MIGRRRFLQASAAAAAKLSVGCSRRQEVPAGRHSASLWFSYGGRNRQVLEELVERFNDSQAEYFIRAIYQGDYFEALAKLRTAIAARAGPGLSHVVGEVIPYLAEADVLEPLEGYPGARALDVIEALGQKGTFIGGDGRPLVALPFNRSTPIAYLNGEMLDRSGLRPPATWSELIETARALTVRQGTNKRFGFECPISWWFWVALVGQAGGRLVEPDGTVSLGGDAGVRAIGLWQKLVHDDRSMKPPPGRDFNAWEATNQDFLAGRVAMIWTSTAFLKYLEQNARFDVRAAPLPKHRRAAVPTGGTFFVMLRAAPDREKEAGWAFLRWMMGPEQTIFWATQTGYMPVTRGAVRQLEARGYYRKNPNDRVAYDQLDVAMPWPWATELFRVQREIVQPRLEDAVLLKKDPGAVLSEARRLANARQR